MVRLICHQAVADRVLCVSTRTWRMSKTLSSVRKIIQKRTDQFVRSHVKLAFTDWLCTIAISSSSVSNDVVLRSCLKLDPEINRVDLWRSIWGKYRSTRSIDSTFDPSYDSARLSASTIDSIDSTDFILDSLYLPRFLADHTNGRAYATVVLRPSPSVVIVDSELWINDACVLEQN